MRHKTLIGLILSAALLAVPCSARAGDDDSRDHDKHTSIRAVVINRSGPSFLGVGVADIDTDRARELRLKNEYGVEIKSVEKDSPAEKAGMKEGDVVLEFNGERVEGTAKFIRMVRETPTGRPVKLLVSHDGDTRTVSATIGTRKPRVFRFRSRGDGNNMEMISPEAPEPPEAPEALDPDEAPEAPEPPDSAEDIDIEIPDIPEINIPEVHMPELPRMFMSWQSPKLGIESESLTPQLAEYFGVKAGVLVRSVSKGSAAERAGLLAGDIVTKVNDSKIASPGEIAGALRSVDHERSFLVTVMRKGKEVTLTAKLDEEKKHGEMAPLPRSLGTPRARSISFGLGGSHI